ncbi:MAG: hypothetical protein QOG59_2592 [Solirubrobacteraceae bacterium]|nr:hypothetical protein [Solirubrobacteraceae bacterium]
MARHANLRASDSDRELVAERLRQAAAEGRLLAEELEARLARALRARTYAELDPLVSDLPLAHRRASRASQLAPLGALVVAGIVAVAVVGVLIAVAVMVITGFMFAWGFWIVLAWFIFGRGRRGGWHHGGPRRMQRGRRTQVRYAHRRTLL